MPPSNLFLALTLFWRAAWRSAVIALYTFMIPGLLVGVGMASAAGAGKDHGHLLVLLAVVSFFPATAWYFWQLSRVYGDKMFRRPVAGRQGGAAWRIVPMHENSPLKTPLPSRQAFGLMWGVLWRAWILSFAVNALRFMTMAFGAPFSSGWEWMGAAFSIGLQIFSMYWLIRWPYGKTRIGIVPVEAQNAA